MEWELTNSVTNLEVLRSSPLLVINIAKDSPASRVTNLVHSCIWNLHCCHHHHDQNHSSLYQSHGCELCRSDYRCFSLVCVLSFCRGKGSLYMVLTTPTWLALRLCWNFKRLVKRINRLLTCCVFVNWYLVWWNNT